MVLNPTSIPTRGAALVSKHGPTCRRVAQSLGAAGLQVRSTKFPSELPIESLRDVAALLVDLDVAPQEPVAKLVAEARSHYRGVPSTRAWGSSMRCAKRT